MSYKAFLKRHHIEPKKIKPVHGGDINKAWRVETASAVYFLKQNDAAAFPGMMTSEAEGLQALAEGSELVIPSVIAAGVEDGQQFLLLQWLNTDHANQNSWLEFGNKLALMHRQPQPYFGWKKDNYIGSLVQTNAQKERWTDFYCECRIMPLADKLYQQNVFTKYELGAAQKLCLRIPMLFPTEPPSLLHGDLWSGNFLFTNGGKPAIYDPAVYYGHREMDIAMTKLFGGFDAKFYEAYIATYPLENGWQDRIQLAQLFPVLVHAVLFGGHYVQQATNIIRQYS